MESDVGLSISEPPGNVAESDCWFISKDNLVAVLWNVECSGDKMCKKTRSRKGFVVVKFGEINVISCYISPNISTVIFENILDDLSNSLKTLTGPVLIGGDFNSKSRLWGSSRTERRGTLLESFSASFDLRLLNQYGVPTCVRPQGVSVVDLTWVTPSFLGLTQNWIVRDDLESLSDHLYIDFRITFKSDNNSRINRKRWNIHKMDKELFVNTLFLATNVSEVNMQTSECYVKWLAEIMKDSCNVSTPKITVRSNRRHAYWWSAEIAEIRKTAVKTRRLTKLKRKNKNIDEALANYKAIKKSLRTAIKKAKNKAWTELIQSIEKHPWGLPYKLVMRKIRRTSPTLSETLDRTTLSRLLDSLFPNNIDRRTVPNLTDDWNEDLRVTMREVEEHVTKRNVRNMEAPNSPLRS